MHLLPKTRPPHPLARRAALYLCCLLLALTGCRRAPAVTAALGEAAEVDGWRVTVHSAGTVTPDPYHPPEPGHVFFSVELTLENRSGAIRFFMPEKQMRLVDASGTAYPVHPTAAVAVARQSGWVAPDGEMSAGEEAHGAASYQVPEGAQGLRWVLTSGLLPGSPTIEVPVGDAARAAED